MSEAPDNRDRVIDDLMTWIRQNGGDEGGWYIEEAPPEDLGEHYELEPSVNEEVTQERPAGGSEPSAPEPTRPTAQAALPLGGQSSDTAAAVPPGGNVAPATSASEHDPDDAFARATARFVADTLGLMDRHGAVLGMEALPGEPVADKAAALAELKARVLPCTNCDLSKGRTNTVFGAGNPDADLVFIGEAPGAEEDRQGEPFVGRSGQLLTRILGAIGYAREEVFICNILKCRPPNNRDPQPAEVAACEPHLKAQLAILRPKVICCLGRVAAQTLLKTTASLGKLRSTVHFYAGIPVMATYHPAALLRNPRFKRDTWNDVRMLRALVDALKARES